MHQRENKDIVLHQLQQLQRASSFSDDDNFGFNEEVSFFEDAKNYDEESGTDKDDA